MNVEGEGEGSWKENNQYLLRVIGSLSTPQLRSSASLQQQEAESDACIIVKPSSPRFQLHPVISL